MDQTIFKLLQVNETIDNKNINITEMNQRLQKLYQQFNPNNWKHAKASIVFQALNKVDQIINNKDMLESYMKDGTKAFLNIRKGHIYINWSMIREATNIIAEVINTTPNNNRQNNKTMITDQMTSPTITKHRFRKGDIRFLIESNDYQIPRGIWITKEEVVTKPEMLKQYMKEIARLRPRSLTALLKKYPMFIKHITK